MEMVLEAVELGTTYPFQNFDEMVVLILFLSQFPYQFLGRSGNCHAVLAATISEAGTDDYVCDSNLNENRSFVLLLGNDASAPRFPISRYYKLAQSTVSTNFIIHHYTSTWSHATLSCMLCERRHRNGDLCRTFELNFGFRSACFT